MLLLRDRRPGSSKCVLFVSSQLAAMHRGYIPFVSGFEDT